MPHRSDSAVQREVESLIRERIASIVGKDLVPATVALETGASVQVDGVATDESVLVEVFAHRGKLKGGQQKKVGLDAFKLITLGRSRPDSELILAFADEGGCSPMRSARVGWQRR